MRYFGAAPNGVASRNCCATRLGRGPRHSDVDYLPRVQLEEEEDEGPPKEESHHRQKIARPDVSRMMLEKGRPGLAGSARRARLAHVLLDGAFGYVETELEEFPVDAFGAPQMILGSQALNQSDGFRRQFRTTAAIARFEFPKESKALAMPTREGARLNQKRFFPVFHAGSEEDAPKAIRLSKGSEKYLYRLTTQGNLAIIDISSPAQPDLVTSFNLGFDYYASDPGATLAAAGSYVYAVNDTGLHILDASKDGKIEFVFVERSVKLGTLHLFRQNLLDLDTWTLFLLVHVIAFTIESLDNICQK